MRTILWKDRLMAKKSTQKAILDELTSDEALAVLRILLKEHAELRTDVCSIILRSMDDTTMDEITGDVYHALNTIDVDELYRRSGKTRYGYINPSDEAWQMVEDAVAPFITEMKKCHTYGLPDAAKKYCLGIIEGLMKFSNTSGSDFREWVDDLEDYAATVFEEWTKGEPATEDRTDVIYDARDAGVRLNDKTAE